MRGSSAALGREKKNGKDRGIWTRGSFFPFLFSFLLNQEPWTRGDRQRNRRRVGERRIREEGKGKEKKRDGKKEGKKKKWKEIEKIEKKSDKRVSR